MRRGLAHALIGIALLVALWHLASLGAAANPRTAAFAGLAPGPAFAALLAMLGGGELWRAIQPSLIRIGQGLAWAVALGVPTGIAIGHFKTLEALTHLPFQFLRMISPLAWMPVAVMAFATWDGAIVFLIAAAAIWPVTFATAAGLRKLYPQWFKVARNLGAGPRHVLVTLIVPAIATDILTGIRLALGVAWIVLVPAEFLGVTSGLGYAINDARDTLSYDKLAAMVIIIGIIGFGLDAVCLGLIRRFSWRRTA
ncbi:ABC transporter permease [Paramagnetospirillum marisnigri]|nr:ABC transporter permease [Paramagnetospirillum marisnigri]